MARPGDKVYVVTAGEYSDFHLVGIFSDRDKADAYVAEDRRDEYSEANDVEEWTIDELCGMARGPIYPCRIDLESGEVVHLPTGRPDQLRHPDRCRVRADDRRIWVDSPVSAEHAAKVAIEERQGWLRTRGMEG